MYIHYGANTFCAESFIPIRNEGFNKPTGGLWASPIDAEYGWKDFCDYFEFSKSDMNKCFTFTLKKGARVLHLRNMLDFDSMPLVKKWDGISVHPDFEALARSYDAIELHYSSNDDGLCCALNGWDCDSIVIMNPRIIELK